MSRFYVMSFKELQNLKRLLNETLESTLYSFFYIAIVVLDLLCLALQSSELIPRVVGWSVKIYPRS